MFAPTQRRKCFPKLSRLRKDLWAWHSDVESLMQELDAPKKNALVKDENTEDKMGSKCLEMIHKLCKFSELSSSEILELLKDIDIPRPISRFASSGQLVTSKKSVSPTKPRVIRGRTRSMSPERRKPLQQNPKDTKDIRERGRSRERVRGRSSERGCSKDRGSTPKCLNATWTCSETSSTEEDPCKKQLTFDDEDGFLETKKTKPSIRKGRKKADRSPVTDRNTKRIIRDLEEQIIELEKENGQLSQELEKLEQEVQWYKENRDYWVQYCRDNDRTGSRQSYKSNRSTGEYEQLRKQYDHLQRIYEDISNSIQKKGNSQHYQELQSEAERYRSERNNARLQVQEMTDKLNWYKQELQTLHHGDRRKPQRRYNKKYFV